MQVNTQLRHFLSLFPPLSLLKTHTLIKFLIQMCNRKNLQLNFLFFFPLRGDAEAFKMCKNTIKLINLCALPCMGLTKKSGTFGWCPPQSGLPPPL